MTSSDSLVNKRVIHQINPATGQWIRDYKIASDPEIHQTVLQSHQAFSVWRQSNLKSRAAVLGDILSILYDQSDKAAALISEETGKPLHDALEGDIAPALNVLRYYADLGPKRLTPKKIQPDGLSLISGRNHLETYHPRGVIGVISPWNYPLGIPVSSMAAALMSGNTVILKPSELAPGSGLWMVQQIRQSLAAHGYPSDIVQCLLGDGGTGARLISDHINGIIFTGSVSTGRKIRIETAERGLWQSLEMGGSDAMIVMDGCSLEMAASYAIWGRYTNAGQACASVKRLYVPEHALPEMLAHLKSKMAQLKLGLPEESGTHIGPLISEAHRALVDSQVQDALERGAVLHAGGQSSPGPGWFYEPTLLSEVPDDARVWKEEVFGPVLPVKGYRHPEEAIALVNASEFGLTASLMGPVAESRRWVPHLACGTVMINDAGPSNYAMVSAPWGGWKNSGLGASHGEQALLDLSQVQVVSVNRYFSMPFLEKPLWHFSQKPALTEQRSQSVLAFAAGHPSRLHPKRWWTFWQNRTSTKI